jgi:hypothetical protein
MFYHERFKRAGYLLVSQTGARFAVAGTQGTVNTGNEPHMAEAFHAVKTKPAPGLYRITFKGNFINGFDCTIGRKLKVETALKDLERRGVAGRAMTRSPGIQGFSEREHASQGAMDNRAQEARRIRQLLVKWLAEVTEGVRP